jgi:hypothetical protein
VEIRFRSSQNQAKPTSIHQVFELSYLCWCCVEKLLHEKRSLLNIFPRQRSLSVFE